MGLLSTAVPFQAREVRSCLERKTTTFRDSKRGDAIYMRSRIDGWTSGCRKRLQSNFVRIEVFLLLTITICVCFTSRDKTQE